MNPSNRRTNVRFYVSGNMDTELRRECFKLGISQPVFMRALIKDYFLRNHGIDLDLQKKERVAPPSAPKEDLSPFDSEGGFEF